MEKIKIGIDVDDCMCNTLEMDFAVAYFKLMDKFKNIDEIEPNHYDVTKLFNMKNGDDFYIEEKKYIMKNTSMYPKMFVKEVLKKLKQKGFEIIIITSRAEKFWNGKAEKYLKKWLHKYDIPYDKIFVGKDEKAKICEEIGIKVMIEDNANHVQKINEKGISTILIKSDYNKNYKNKLNAFAQNWLVVYKILCQRYNLNYSDII